ncbi:MAG: hypothetical protein ACFFBD_01415, partial [Candidatus Hodarchaeota archaeon]
MYLENTFTEVRFVLNQTWIERILKNGFTLYIEQEVAKGWTEEETDLTRELIRYWQYLANKNQTTKINTMVINSLKDALEASTGLDKSKIENLLNELLDTLPEPIIDDVTTAKNYLTQVYNLAKPVINSLLRREVQEEKERITFTKELTEKTSLDQMVRFWFSVKSFFYKSVFSEINTVSFVNISMQSTEQQELDASIEEWLYGGVIHLVEQNMAGLRLTDEEKKKKVFYLISLLSNQINNLASVFKEINVNLTSRDVVQFVKDQILLFNDMFTTRNILLDLSSDNTMAEILEQKKEEAFKRRAHFLHNLGITQETFNYEITEFHGIRGFFSHRKVSGWIRNWANSVFDLVENKSELLPEDLNFDDFLEKVFQTTGRDNILNLVTPLLVGNIKRIFSSTEINLPKELEKYQMRPSRELTPLHSHLIIGIYYFEQQQLSKRSWKL